MKILNKLLLLLLLLLSTLSFGCNKTYYWYSHQSTQLPPSQLAWFNSDGSIKWVESKNDPLQLPDGTLYTAIFYSKKGADSYLWPDKKLVKVECTPKEVVEQNKKLMKLIKGK